MAVDSDNCNQSQNVTKRRRCQTSPLLASSRSRGDPKPLSAESECSPKRLKTNTSNPKPRHASHSPPRVEIQHADCEPQRPTEEEIAGEIREYQKITSTLVSTGTVVSPKAGQELTPGYVPIARETLVRSVRRPAQENS